MSDYRRKRSRSPRDHHYDSHKRHRSSNNNYYEKPARKELKEKYGDKIEMKAAAEINVPALTANYVTAHRNNKYYNLHIILGAMATKDAQYAPFFQDPWAAKMAGEVGFKKVEHVDEKGTVYPTVVVRSIFIDEYLKRCVPHFDVKQVS